MTPSPDAAMQCAKAYARREPGKTVAAAFGAGLLLSLLPYRSIALGVTRAVFTFVPPALLLIELQKACACCCAQDPDLERK